MRLYFNTERDRFEIESAYSDRFACKDAGFWWDRSAKRWYTTFPERALRMRHVAEQSALDALDATEKALDASRATDSTIKIPAPEGQQYFPFQRAGIAFAAKRDSVLIADEMGLGKTIQAIGLLNTRSRDEALPALVICPASLKINWRREVAKWLTHEATVAEASGSSVPFADVVIVNYDILSRNMPRLLARDWKALIVDEAHYAKTLRLGKGGKWVGSQRAKCVQKLAAKVARKAFLTGTPITNRPKELFPLLTMLDPKTWPANGFFKYGIRYCDGQCGRWGWDFDGASNLDELQTKLRSSIMVRRLKADVLADLPAKTRTLVTLQAKRGDLTHERGFGAKMDAVVSENYVGDVNCMVGGGAVEFAELSKVRHQTALKKVGRVADFCRERLDEEDKLIVFAHHKDVVASLVADLAEFNPVTITGADSMVARDAAVQRFQSDPACRVVVGNIKAAGVGLTLTAARTVVFAELDWVPANVTQAEDRAHRIGQRDNVTVYHVVLQGSLDERLAKTLVAKQFVMDEALDNRTATVAPKPTAPETEEPARQRSLPTPRPTKPVAPKPPVTVPDEAREAIHRALQALAGVCDGALERDGAGFSKFDTRFGTSLAYAPRLTDRQALAGAKLVRKYRRQLGNEAVAQAAAVLQ